MAQPAYKAVLVPEHHTKRVERYIAELEAADDILDPHPDTIRQ